MRRYILTLDKIHCVSCVDTIRTVINKALPESLGSQVSIEDKTATVFLPEHVSLDRPELSRRFVENGFKLVSVDDIDIDEGWFERIMTNWKKSKTHRQNCKECRMKSKRASHVNLQSLKSALSASGSDTGLSSSSLSDDRLSKVTTISPEDEKGDAEVEEFRAQFSIGGMSCASCTNTITSMVESELPQVLDFAVDLVNSSAVAVINDKRLANKIQHIIKDVGFSCELVELLPVKSTRCWKVVASVGGMSCSACVNTITQQIELLPFVEKVDINLLTNSATIIVNNVNKVDQLKETVEDCGFDYDQVEVKEVRHTTISKKSRTVNLEVEGMFCE